MLFAFWWCCDGLGQCRQPVVVHEVQKLVTAALGVGLGERIHGKSREGGRWGLISTSFCPLSGERRSNAFSQNGEHSEERSKFPKPHCLSFCFTSALSQWVCSRPDQEPEAPHAHLGPLEWSRPHYSVLSSSSPALLTASALSQASQLSCRPPSPIFLRTPQRAF